MFFNVYKRNLKWIDRNQYISYSVFCVSCPPDLNEIYHEIIYFNCPLLGSRALEGLFF